MKTKIFDSNYKDQKAISVESAVLKACFLPELGGKMASLVFKDTAREFFVQDPGKTYRVLRYDGSYTDSECSGFDDMFPSIDPCCYERYPWAGVMVPDHGEVCSLHWNYEIRDDELVMWTYGVRFPYRLQKRIRFLRENSLRIDYQLINLSDFEMDFIWAAHPMINAEADAELILPYPEDSAITCVYSTDKDFGSYGYPMKWPLAVRQDSGLQALNVSRHKSVRGINYKFYFNSKIPEGWFKYRYKSDQTTLTLSFPEEQVPYFSIWVNEGSFRDYYNFAPEPCTAAFDRIDRSVAHGMGSSLKARGEHRWHLAFDVERD